VRYAEEEDEGRRPRDTTRESARERWIRDHPRQVRRTYDSDHAQPSARGRSRSRSQSLSARVRASSGGRSDLRFERREPSANPRGDLEQPSPT
jgi:hypothetical protein